MKFAAFEEHSADVHGNYEHWEPAAEDTSQPDCEDDLMQVEPEEGRLLMVKIPKHLMERWSAVEEEDVHLATIRMYPARASSTSGARAKPRVVLTLPPAADDDGLGADEYEMDIAVPDPKAMPFNEYVVAEYDSAALAPGPEKSAGAREKHNEKEKAKGKGKARRRRAALAGAVTHHCSLRAVLSERMRQRVKARSVAANTPKRQIIFLGSSIRPLPLPGVGAANKPFFMKTGKPKGPADRMVRLPRHKLLDMLFRLFADRPRWSFRLLRERTQQPEAFLKEVLPEIAFLHRTGEHHGCWELSPSYGGKQEDASPAGAGTAEKPIELADDDDDSEDDDSDLEEVF